MHVTCNTQDLGKELRALAKIVPSKPSIPILSHVLIRADDKLRLYATNLEIGLSTTCLARIVMPGVVTLPLAKLAGVVDQLPDADITIELDGKHVKITSGVFKSRLQAMPADDFPALPDVEGVSSTLDARAFRQMIDRTKYAIAVSSDKYMLQGALLTLAGPAAAMCATDSKRLALTTMSRTGADAKVIIPVETLDVLNGQGDTDIELTIGTNHLFFAQGERLLVSRTIDGQFPNYDRIIPKANSLMAVVDRAKLAAVIRRIGLASEQNRGTYFSFSTGELIVSASSAEFGEAEEPLPVTYDGPAMKLCADWRFVLDFLEAASGETVMIALKDDKSPMLLTDGDDYLYVMTLMRL